MEGILTTVSLLSVFGIFIIALSIWNTGRNKTEKLFSTFSILLAAFMLLQLLVDLYPDNAKLFIQISSLFAYLLAVVFFVFAFTFPNLNNLKITFKNLLLISFPFIFFTAINFSSLIVQDAYVEGGELVFEAGSLYLVQSLLIISYFLAGLCVLVRRYIKSKNIGIKNQIRLLIISFLVPVVGIVVTGLIFVNTQEIQVIRPLSVLVMVFIIGYGMIFHELFDIRAFVARSIAYILTLFMLFAVPVLVGTFMLSNFSNISFSYTEIWILILISIVLAILFQPAKKFFDKFTNSIFYRDAYDTQDLINDFNQIVISTIDINELLNKSSSTINSYLSSKFNFFGLRSSDGDYLRYINTSKHEIGEKSIEQMRAYLKNSDNKVFQTNVDFEQEPDLKELLSKQDIDVVVRITNRVDMEGTGYLFLGPKKSGNLYSNQDVKALEIIANELVIAIQNALQFEEIQKFTVTLQEKVDEATKELKKSNEKLKALDEAKDEFISMASHQLRTPLTSIKGYLSMLMEGDAGKVSKAQEDMISSAFTSSQRMVYLIADLLNVSRLKTGKFIIEQKEVDLPEVVEGEVMQLQETAKNRRLKLKYKKPKKFPDVSLDETKIRQVIMNFMDNAIYYTPAGGEINVVLEFDSKSISYKVIDNGIGVPKDQQHKLFTKFYRAGNAKKSRPDGTGLGLFMAQKVIVAQEGSIIFNSEEGKGSTFGFTFPRSKVEIKEEPAKKSKSPKRKTTKKKAK